MCIFKFCKPPPEAELVPLLFNGGKIGTSVCKHHEEAAKKH